VHLNALLDKPSFDDGLHLNRSAYFSLAEFLSLVMCLNGILITIHMIF
jgi:NAD(P)-dependent dehydrogenase (short-subunit alcohol dehydrogenase family)